MFKNLEPIPNPGKTPVSALKAPDQVQRLYCELETHIHAKDEKGVRRVFRELLGTGRSREEIVSQVIRLLDQKPSASDVASNGTDRHWRTEPTASVGPSQVGRYQSPAAWPDIAPQFADDAADRKALGPSSNRAPLEPGLRQQAGGDQQERPKASQSENGPHSVLESSSPDKGAPAKRQASESTRGPSPTKTEAEPYLPALEKEASSREQTKQRRRLSLAKDRGEASISSPQPARARGQASRGTCTLSPPIKSTEHLSTPENARTMGEEANKSTLTPDSTKNAAETDVSAESAIPPRAALSTSPDTASRPKNGVEVTARPDPSERHDQAEKVGDKQHDAATAREPTSDTPEKPFVSFFANTSPRQVGLRSDNRRESVPERLVSGLHLQSSGTSSAEPGTMKKHSAAQTDAPLADWPESLPESPKAPSRPSATAVRVLTVVSLLVAAIGGFYVLWGFYGNELEQAGLTSARGATTWLQENHGGGLSLKPEVASTMGKTVDSQQTEAAVTNVSKGATTDTASSKVAALTTTEGSAPKAADRTVAALTTTEGSAPKAPDRTVAALIAEGSAPKVPDRTVAALIAEGSAPKVPDRTVAALSSEDSTPNGPESLDEPKGAPGASNNPQAPTTSSTVELSANTTKRDEPNTKPQSARPKGGSKSTVLNEIPRRKPTLPNSQTSQYNSQPDQSPLVSGTVQRTRTDAAGLVTRGDQLLGMRDVAAARLFYERAAEAGDGEGALRMGMTFDPLFLERSGLRGVRSDPGQAAAWYYRAAALGNTKGQALSERGEGMVK